MLIKLYLHVGSRCTLIHFTCVENISDIVSMTELLSVRKHIYLYLALHVRYSIGDVSQLNKNILMSQNLGCLTKAQITTGNWAKTHSAEDS